MAGLSVQVIMDFLVCYVTAYEPRNGYVHFSRETFIIFVHQEEYKYVNRNLS